MQDFSEIAEALIRAGGAVAISGGSDLTALLNKLLASPDVRTAQGLAAKRCIEKQRGVIEKHLELIDRIL